MAGPGQEGGQWRAFVGDWSDGEPPHDWVHFDESGLSWEEAQAAIRARLEGFRTDDCSYCRGTAEEGLAKLDQVPAGEPFEWDVDGDDFVVAPGMLAVQTRE